MPLLGQAAVAMWWDMAQAQRAEFEDWHSHEHFPERLSIPGFRRGSRWRSVENTEGFFVFYELAGTGTLTSPEYLDRLNNPTPWSTKMMPHHRNMVRSLSRVLESRGSGIGGFIATLRLSPRPGQEDALRTALATTLAALAILPGIVGGHLLQTQTPQIAPTTEQKIRGGDAAADWIVLIFANDLPSLRAVTTRDLSAERLGAAGAVPGTLSSLFQLSHAITPADLAL